MAAEVSVRTTGPMLPQRIPKPKVKSSKTIPTKMAGPLRCSRSYADVCSEGTNPAITLEPSKGERGIKLNTAKRRLKKITNPAISASHSVKPPVIT